MFIYFLVDHMANISLEGQRKIWDKIKVTHGETDRSQSHPKGVIVKGNKR